MWTVLLCLHRMSLLIFFNNEWYFKFIMTDEDPTITPFSCNYCYLCKCFPAFGLALLFYELHWQEFFQTTKMPLWHLTFFIKYHHLCSHSTAPLWNYILQIKKDIRGLTKRKRKERGMIALQPTSRLKIHMVRNVPGQWRQLAWKGSSIHLYPSRNYYPPKEDG